MFEHRSIHRVNIDRLMGRNLGVILSAPLTPEGEQTRVKGTVGLASSTVMVVVLFIVFSFNMSLVPLLAAAPFPRREREAKLPRLLHGLRVTVGKRGFQRQDLCLS